MQTSTFVILTSIAGKRKGGAGHDRRKRDDELTTKRKLRKELT